MTPYLHKQVARPVGLCAPISETRETTHRLESFREVQWHDNWEVDLALGNYKNIMRLFFNIMAAEAITLSSVQVGILEKMSKLHIISTP